MTQKQQSLASGYLGSRHRNTLRWIPVVLRSTLAQANSFREKPRLRSSATLTGDTLRLYPDKAQEQILSAGWVAPFGGWDSCLEL